jgi:hypothetical protein
MASLSSPTLVEQRGSPPSWPAATGPARHDVLLVADLGNPVAADYIRYVAGQKDRPQAVITEADLFQRAADHRPLNSVVLFLPPRWTDRDRVRLDSVFRIIAEQGIDFVGIVSSFQAHLDDADVVGAETYTLGRAAELHARVAVFRPGFVLSPSSRTSAFLRRSGCWFPLVPSRLRSCCLDGAELFAAIESERRNPRPRRARIYTLLGPNRPWRSVLASHRTRGLWQGGVTLLSALMALLLIGHLAGLILNLLTRWYPRLRAWEFDTLRPGSFQELLALVNKYSYRYVKVVGYNNGVTHFGQHFPGKTIVSTAGCHRIRRTARDRLKVDCGATIGQTQAVLAAGGQELYVLPNYSYVCLGTSFFVPIHGSASDYSTVADTITNVLLYDPVSDRFVRARRDQSAFRDHLYRLPSDVLLLRLGLRVKSKSRYFVCREELEAPGSAEILSALRDPRAANAEIRKARASSRKVTICKYHKDPGDANAPLLEVPRDSLGRLWDRLEANPITSFLFHGLTRYLGWHVELFFTAAEFATFWDTHASLPLIKIQLRYIRRDGFPHSPFRDDDCVSADLFMLRRHRRAFEAYLKRTFRIVRANPGKHSA